MKLYIQQKVFSISAKFNVCDEQGNEIYKVESEVFTFGGKYHIYDRYGQQVCYIHQKLWSWMPRYFIALEGQDEFEMVKNFTFFRAQFELEGYNWMINGDFFNHEYDIDKEGHRIASISKKWFSWSDCYCIDIDDNQDALMALAVVICIDHDMQTSENAVVASSTANCR